MKTYREGLLFACSVLSSMRDQLGDYAQTNDQDAATQRGLDAARQALAEEAEKAEVVPLRTRPTKAEVLECPTALSEQACTIGMSGNAVTVDCDERAEAEELFEWLSEAGYLRAPSPEKAQPAEQAVDAEIAALRHDLIQSMDTCTEYVNQARALEGEVERLRAALRPFSEKANKREAYTRKRYPNYVEPDSMQITHRLGDFRRARAALADTGGEG